MTTCIIEAIVIEQDCPVDAIIIEEPQEIAVITDIQQGPKGDKGDTGDTGPVGPPGGTVDGNVRDELPIVNAGDTMFNLSQVVTDPSLTRVFLNGQKLIYGQGYNFSSSMAILVYISSLYDLEPDDTLEIYYSV